MVTTMKTEVYVERDRETERQRDRETERQREERKEERELVTTIV